MPSLSSLIVQRQVATIAEVEQAIARQVIHGGDLVTNLLEVSPQCEHSLTRVLAECLGIPSVPPGRLPAPDNDVLDIVPVETTLRYGIFPLRRSVKTLVMATSDRLKPTALHDLAYTLGYDLSQVAAPLIRIREGIAAHYGVPLEPRQLRLVQRLDGMMEGVGQAPTRPYSAVHLPPSASILPSNLGSGVSTHPAAKSSSEIPAVKERTGSTLEMEEVREDSPRPSVHDSSEDDDAQSLLDPQQAETQVPGRVAFIEEPPPSSVSSIDWDESASTSKSEATQPDLTPLGAEVQDEGTLDEPSGPRTEPQEEADDKQPAPPSATAPASARTAALVTTGDWISLAEATSATDPSSLEQTWAGEDLVDQNALTRAVPAVAEIPVRADTPAPTAISDEDDAAAWEEAAAHNTPSNEAPTFPPGDSPRPPTMVDRRAVANLLKREIGSRRRATITKSARKKGPFSRNDAERELESTRSPDEVLDTFFAFGSQFFEYSALFVVHGELVEGRDAWGPGADHLRVLGLGVPLDLPSSLATVRRESNVMLSRFEEHDLDRELVRDLERSRSRPSLAAVIPLTVKRRAVAMLYGDDGPSDVTLGGLGDLIAFSALASAQVERIAVAKKSRSGPFSGLVAPRVQPSSVEALARAFSLPVPNEFQPSIFATRSNTPSSGTPLLLDARVSPGATSVHPPPRITAPWAGGDADEDEEVTLARRPRAVPDVPHRSDQSELATAETAIASTALIARTMGAGADVPSSGGISYPGPRDSTPPPAASSPPPERRLHSPLSGLADGESYGSSRPQPASPSHPVRDVNHEMQLLTPRESSRAGSTPSQRGQGFVPPIPRTDDEDASVLVVEHGDADAVMSMGAPTLRDEPDPVSDGRGAGSYHLVPRPADARLRSDAPDLHALLDRALAGGLEGEEALSELLRRAEDDFPRLVERFPGPLAVDRLRARADLPPASECGPLLKVLVTMRRGALPFMTVRSTSTDVEQRFWATHVLGELMLPEASNAILPRLFDDDVSVRRVARRAAQALASAGAPGEPLKHSLANTMRNSEEPMQRRLLAIEALSDIRVPSVVPILVSVLRDETDAIIDAARTALMVVTRQDLGRNPQVWQAWWEIHQHEHRVEWLIQALTHETASIRRTASDELKMLTREYFGYYDDLPPRERERAQSRYIQWWQDEGQYRYR